MYWKNKMQQNYVQVEGLVVVPAQFHIVRSSE